MGRGRVARRDADSARRRHVARFPATRDRERRPRRGLRREHHRRPRGGGLRLGGRDVRPGPGRPRLARPRRRADVDRVAAVPDDATHGEHAAAFLSGNFQPLEEEITASAIVRTRRATPRRPPRRNRPRRTTTATPRWPRTSSWDPAPPGDRQRGHRRPGHRAGARRRLGRLGALRVHVLGGGDVRDARLGSLPRVPRGGSRASAPTRSSPRSTTRCRRRPRARKRRRGRRWHHWFGRGMVCAVGFSPGMDRPRDGRRLRG